MSSATRKSGAVRDSYLEMVQDFPLVSIRNDRDLKKAQKFLDSMFAREPLDDGEELYLEALSDLVELYESQHVKIDAPSDAAVLEHLMQARKLSQKQLAEGIGILKSTISEVLSGKRQLTRQQIAKLARFFRVPQGVFQVSEEEK